MISNVSASAGSVSSASLDQPLEVGLLVVGREEVRQARDARGHERVLASPDDAPQAVGHGHRHGLDDEFLLKILPVVEADHVDRTLAEVAVDDVRGAPKILVEARPVVDDVDAREPPLDVLSVP